MDNNSCANVSAISLLAEGATTHGVNDIYTHYTYHLKIDGKFLNNTYVLARNHTVRESRCAINLSAAQPTIM